jgi:N-glycosylase/DNA lyase
MSRSLKVKLQHHRPTQVLELKQRYVELRDMIRERLNHFAHVPTTEYFYELLYCLLTPQTSAANADHAVRKLYQLGFREREFDPEPILSNKEHYIRFHKTKSRHLLQVKGNYIRIATAISNGTQAFAMREWLVENVMGLGYKEATHFLRNIGKNGGLAILDRHILRNLLRYGVLRQEPQSLTKKIYIDIEQQFIQFSQTIGIPVDELDLLFWSMETGVIMK